MPISSRPKTERPRERLLEQGAKVLSDAELLLKFGGLRGFLAADPQHLKKKKAWARQKSQRSITTTQIYTHITKAGIYGRPS